MVIRTVFLALSLSACLPSARECPVRVDVQRVEVPVPVQAAAPAELLQCQARGPYPVFLPPADPAASSCVSQEGELRMRNLIETERACRMGWQAWGQPDGS